MLAPNTVLQNRYLVVQSIGRGGMGAVYLAIDQRLSHAVALKETFFSDPDELAKAFEREAQLLARLRHPALPRVSDHFIENGQQFLVMEYIAGDDISKSLASRGGEPFEIHRVLAWADELLDALQYLHSQEPPILHRDIKPQNLKLTARDQIVLLDFGLAKGESNGEVSLSSVKPSIYGYTPNYAPLEQIKGTGTEPRSDLYALAATVYHLMTSVAPPSALARVEAVIENRPDPLRRADMVHRQVTPAIARVLKRAMALNRDGRFASATEMRSELREAAQLSGITEPTFAATPFLAAGANALSENDARDGLEIASLESSQIQANGKPDAAPQTPEPVPVLNQPFVEPETPTIVRPNTFSSPTGNRQMRSVVLGLFGAVALIGALAGIYLLASANNGQPVAPITSPATSDVVISSEPSPDVTPLLSNDIESNTTQGVEERAIGTTTTTTSETDISQMQAGLDRLRARRAELITNRSQTRESTQARNLNRQITRLEEQVRTLRQRLDNRPARQPVPNAPNASSRERQRTAAATITNTRPSTNQRQDTTSAPRPSTVQSHNNRNDVRVRTVEASEPPAALDPVEEERRREQRERRRRARRLREDLNDVIIP